MMPLRLNFLVFEVDVSVNIGLLDVEIESSGECDGITIDSELVFF